MSSKRVTQKDLARELGLSVQAVSMALRDLKDVSSGKGRRGQRMYYGFYGLI